MFEQIMDVRPEMLVPPGLTATGEPWSWGPTQPSSLLVP